MMRHPIRFFWISVFLLIPAAAWGAHPLITDDAGTLGRGKSQIEFAAQYDSDKETVAGVSVESSGNQISATFSYGFAETLDLVLGLPCQRNEIKEDGVKIYDEKGVSDMTFEIKWHFFEREGFSLALKPGVKFPTGNDDKGLGAGRTGYQAFLIGSQEIEPWSFHLNVGYMRNENHADEEKDIWHASLATIYQLTKNLNIVGNIGVERNTDRDADRNPAFLIGGIVYALSDNLDLDAGVKYGLTSAETDWSLMAGMAFRF